MLPNCPLLCSKESKSARLVLPQVSQRCLRFHKGEVVYSQNAPVNGIWLLCEGEIKLIYRSFEGRKHILAFRKPLSFLGIESISAEYQVASAQAITESRLCIVPKSLFFELLRQDLSQQGRLLLDVSNLLASIFERAVARADEGVLRALIRGLVSISRDEERDNRGNVVLRRSVQEIAEFIFFSKRSTFRALNGLKRKNIVSRHKNGNIEFDLDRLNSLIKGHVKRSSITGV